jgi:hypothetical protein
MNLILHIWKDPDQTHNKHRYAITNKYHYTITNKHHYVIVNVKSEILNSRMRE